MSEVLNMLVIEIPSLLITCSLVPQLLCNPVKMVSQPSTDAA